MGQKLFVYFLFILFSTTVSAQNLFESLRNDSLIPQHCHQVKLSHFSDQIFYFTVGIQGSKKHGFDFEHPIQRSAVTRLWKKALGAKAWGSPNFTVSDSQQDYYQTVMTNAPLMDFDLSSEGEILELLGTFLLYDEFPAIDANNMYITGSVAYHSDDNSKVIGELDFIIADKTSCTVLAIGEAKLGTKKLGYAKQQLQRFRSFLAHHKKVNDFLQPSDFFGF